MLNSIVGSLLFLRRGVRAIFYTPEVGFLAIARSCEALENGVSPTWISTTTRSHRAAAVLLPFAKKVVHGKVFSASRRTSSSWENLPADFTLAENGRRVARQVSTARPRTQLSGFRLILWRRMTTTCRARGCHLEVVFGGTSFFFHVVRRCSPWSPGW